MKTIKQWLKEGLSKEDYQKAERYENERWDWKVESFKRAISKAFIWSSTEEDFDYWDKIQLNGGSLKTDNTKQMKTIKQWLKERLSEDDYKKAKQYENERWEDEAYNFEDAMTYSFTWAETKEGEDYWYITYMNGGSLKTNKKMNRFKSALYFAFDWFKTKSLISKPYKKT